MDDFLQVGIISSTHGLQGEVKVFPTTDDVRRFSRLSSVWLDLPDGKLELEVERVRFFKNMAILKFRGMGHIEDVEKYKGKGLFVTRADAVECGEDEYFIADLIGMEAFAEDGRILGTVRDVLQTGANDVYVVKVREDSPFAPRVADKKKELLLPAIKDCVLDVDVGRRRMSVRLMAGLLEEGQREGE